MWRWWILAGVVVMALGVVTMVAATRTGGPSRCIESSKYEYGRPRFDANQVDESFHKLLSSRLDVKIGDTAVADDGDTEHPGPRADARRGAGAPH